MILIIDCLGIGDRGADCVKHFLGGRHVGILNSVMLILEITKVIMDSLRRATNLVGVPKLPQSMWLSKAATPSLALQMFHLLRVDTLVHIGASVTDLICWIILLVQRKEALLCLGFHLGTLGVLRRCSDQV